MESRALPDGFGLQVGRVTASPYALTAARVVECNGVLGFRVGEGGVARPRESWKAPTLLPAYVLLLRLEYSSARHAPGHCSVAQLFPRNSRARLTLS